MTFRLSLFFTALFLFDSSVVGAPGQSDASAERQTLYYLPHTHWEGAVFKTREEYLEMGLPHILKALSLLHEYPEFKFTLDQVAYIKPFLERYPEAAATFRKHVAEGRLQIVGGMDVMPDVVKPGGELFVRQMQFGKRYCGEQLGVDVTVAWLLDTFGHHPQLPQLLRQAGYKSFWFCRGVPNHNLPSEFLWRGIDGTEIPAFWLPGFYGLFFGPPRQPAEFAKFFRQRFNSLNRYARGSARVGLAGVDVSEPEEYAPPLIEQFNRQTDSPFTIHYSVPSEFAEVVARRTNLPVFEFDLSPIFQGTYSSRIELKQTTRWLEQRLLTAEKLMALARWLGTAADEAALWRAWEPVLFNQTHDLASGVMTDHVYEDVLRGYDLAKQISDELIASRWESIAARIDTRGPGIPIVVFNTLGWPRSDVAEVEVGFAEPGIEDFALLNPSGHEVPFQVLQSDKYSAGGIQLTRICFVANEVPALGYATYWAVPKQSAPSGTKAMREVADRNSIENEFYRVTFDRNGGQITSIFDKSQEWEALSGPANVIARQQDKGDLWELYRGLDGGSHLAMTNRQPVPRHGSALLSSEFSERSGSLYECPVFSEFKVAHRFDTGTYAARVRLYTGLRRIELETTLSNNEKYVRYQVLFPTSIHDGRYVQEIPFGAVERPQGIEFAAQQWVDYGDGHRGVALLNAGLPGNLVSENTLMLSLLRSHNLGAYGFGGGYEPGMSSESGFELGRTHTFRYGLLTHGGDWQKAAVYREGLAFNHPFLVHKAALHGGTLPARWGLLEISPSNVVLTAIRPGPGQTTILRMYEADGRSTSDTHIAVHARVIAGREANLLEEPGQKLRVENNTVHFALHPYEIKTVQLQLGDAGKRR